MVKKIGRGVVGGGGSGGRVAEGGEFWDEAKGEGTGKIRIGDGDKQGSIGIYLADKGPVG